MLFFCSLVVFCAFIHAKGFEVNWYVHYEDIHGQERSEAGIQVTYTHDSETAKNNVRASIAARFGSSDYKNVRISTEIRREEWSFSGQCEIICNGNECRQYCTSGVTWQRTRSEAEWAATLQLRGEASRQGRVVEGSISIRFNW